MLLALLCASWLLGPLRASHSPDWVDRFPHLKKAPWVSDILGLPGFKSVIGNITGFRRVDPGGFRIECGRSSVRVRFWRGDVVRIWLAWDGEFEDLATADLVVGAPVAALLASFSDEADYVEMRAAGAPDGVRLRAYKRPLRFAMFSGAGRLLWEESQPIIRVGTATFQTLVQGPEEHFFGGGMQNGRFSHKGHRIRISRDTNWDEGGNPNAAPMYMSSAGYGVFRNTWSPGVYDFGEPGMVVSTHNESRFDAFYFAAGESNFKALLEGYTFVTGRPFMPPIYAFGLGDSDCYHDSRHGFDTNVVLAEVEGYNKHDIPGAWNLPNDGYGCGFGSGNSTSPADFQVLDRVVSELGDRGFVTGLWSDMALDASDGKIRIFKTDVAWVGEGYKFAFDAVQALVQGVQESSDARHLIWTVEGWAGTHRMAVMWTGDDSGNFDYIRWQIPTYAGTGFAAMAHVSGDIDGIFGGSPETYVRDLQFKCLMTVMMTMSGWAEENPNKQPWTYGEPYTSINRMYLRLKMRLVPYFYTLSREAHDTGTPPVRAMAMEFPEDRSLLADHVGSAQQFMAGPSVLVAPVYRPLAETAVRDGIYVPAGRWVDFWSGRIYTGPRTLHDYPAPLEILPMLVRAGSIIPMWPHMSRPAQRPADPLTLDVYPEGHSFFSLYEDDGATRQALEEGAFARTAISCWASPDALGVGGSVRLHVGRAEGNFTGKLAQRAYDIRIHMGRGPLEVRLVAGSPAQALPLPRFESQDALEAAGAGWVYNSYEVGGLAHVKTPALPTDGAFTVWVGGLRAARQGSLLRGGHAEGIRHAGALPRKGPWPARGARPTPAPWNHWSLAPRGAHHRPHLHRTQL